MDREPSLVVARCADGTIALQVRADGPAKVACRARTEAACRELYGAIMATSPATTP